MRLHEQGFGTVAMLARSRRTRDKAGQLSIKRVYEDHAGTTSISRIWARRPEYIHVTIHVL